MTNTSASTARLYRLVKEGVPNGRYFHPSHGNDFKS